MTFLHKILALGLAVGFSGAAHAQDAGDKPDKIATVNMTRLVNAYYKTANTRNSFKQYEARLKESDQKKVEEISELVKESESLREQAQDANVSADKRTELFKKATLKKQRAEQLQKKRVTWAKQKQAAFNDKISVELKAHREEIIAIVQEIGKKEGYDFILNRSGTSGAGVPILSYAKDAADLTGFMLEQINKDAPEPVEKTEEAE